MQLILSAVLTACMAHDVALEQQAAAIRGSNLPDQVKGAVLSSFVRRGMRSHHLDLIFGQDCRWFEVDDTVCYPEHGVSVSRDWTKVMVLGTSFAPPGNVNARCHFSPVLLWAGRDELRLEQQASAIRESNLPHGFKASLLAGLVQTGMSEGDLTRIFGRRIDHMAACTGSGFYVNVYAEYDVSVRLSVFTGTVVDAGIMAAEE